MEKSEFDFWITSPIKHKRPNCFNTLGELIRATCLRRTKNTMQGSHKLPRRIERIEQIKLQQKDQILYDFFRERTAKIAAGFASQSKESHTTNESKGANVLTLINFLRRICNNGEELLPQSALEIWRSKNSSMIDWQMMQNCNQNCDSCGSIIEDTDLLPDDTPEFACRHSICTTCSLQSASISMDEVRTCPKCGDTCVTAENSSPIKHSVRLSAKVEALIQNLITEQTMEQQGDNKLSVKRY